MITIQEEDFSKCYEEIYELGKKHYKEIDVLGLEYNPDVQLYLSIHETGMLLCVTLRNYGKLLGYSISTIGTDLNDKRILTSKSILLFVDKSIRGKGLKLMKYTETLLKSRGVIIHTWDVPASNDFSPVLLRFGYIKTETLYSRRL